MSVHTVINALKDNDKKKFFELRNAMRRAYLISMNKTIGIDKYGLEDDIQMDAIDSTIAGLMQRAGMGDEPENKKEPVGQKELDKLEAEITGETQTSYSKTILGPKAWSTK